MFHLTLKIYSFNAEMTPNFDENTTQMIYRKITIFVNICYLVSILYPVIGTVNTYMLYIGNCT